jgi:hypothetical protein
MAAKAQQTKTLPPIVEHKATKTVQMKKIMVMIVDITLA